LKLAVADTTTIRRTTTDPPPQEAKPSQAKPKGRRAWDISP